MNYLIVVNKDKVLDTSYFEELKLVDCKDVLGDSIKVEEKTYENYLKLKMYLEKIGIFVELDSGFRSIEEQQRIIDDFTNKYGKEYVDKYVAPIGTSEHHTGLALDLALIVDGKKCIENDELFANEEIFKTIHKHLARFGFILRYPKNKEKITGYDYEPWHIRYVGKDVAEKIYLENITLEEYLANYKNDSKEFL